MKYRLALFIYGNECKMTNSNIENIIKKLDLIKASLKNQSFTCEMLANIAKASDDYLRALRNLKD